MTCQCEWDNNRVTDMCGGHAMASAERTALAMEHEREKHAQKLGNARRRIRRLERMVVRLLLRLERRQ